MFIATLTLYVFISLSCPWFLISGPLLLAVPLPSLTSLSHTYTHIHKHKHMHTRTIFQHMSDSGSPKFSVFFQQLVWYQFNLFCHSFTQISLLFFDFLSYDMWVLNSPGHPFSLCELSNFSCLLVIAINDYFYLLYLRTYWYIL